MNGNYILLRGSEAPILPHSGTKPFPEGRVWDGVRLANGVEDDEYGGREPESEQNYNLITYELLIAMRIDIITSVPELLTSPLNESILKRAQDKGLVEIVVHNLHDYAHDRRKTTDDYPFGGEAGMVMKCEPVFELVEKLQSERPYDEIIYTSPDGIRYDQHEANRLSTLENIIILCGHYKGIDHRIREHLVTREISIGDYVLTGGELAACIIADSVVRIIPGAIGDEASALTDSFQDNLLAPPVYTRPAEFRGWRVPDVLLSGNFAEIAKWQDNEAYERTKRLRPDLLNE